jgi:hypothetical protein
VEKNIQKLTFHKMSQWPVPSDFGHCKYFSWNMKPDFGVSEIEKKRGKKCPVEFQPSQAPVYDWESMSAPEIFEKVENILKEVGVW